MTKYIYTVFDKVANTIVGSLITEPHDAPAIRAFHDALGHPNSILSQHPADFDLLKVAEITDTGEVSIGSYPRTVATGTAYLASKESTTNA